MRYSITIETTKTEEANPLLITKDYQYYLGMWLQEILSIEQKLIEDCISKYCQVTTIKKNKFYTFTNADFGEMQVANDFLQLKQSRGKFIFSTHSNDELEQIFLSQIEKNILTIPGKNSAVEFIVKSITPLPNPIFNETMNFVTVSPLTLNYKDHTTNIYNEYMYPKGERFNDLFFINLHEKMTLLSAFDTKYKNFDKSAVKKFQLKSVTKSKSITLQTNTRKPIVIKGYEFNFSLSAAVEYVKAGYYLGFGENNCWGFGLCDNIY